MPEHFFFCSIKEKNEYKHVRGMVRGARSYKLWHVHQILSNEWQKLGILQALRAQISPPKNTFLIRFFDNFDEL